jgi:hypothetical protein
MKIEKWATIPGAPRSSFGHVLHQGKLYIAGGHTGRFHYYEASNFSDEFHCLDVATEKWSALKPLSFPLQGFRMIGEGNYLYAFGGFSTDGRLPPKRPWAAASKDTVLRYSISGDAWEIIGTLPRRRSSYVCARIGKKAYLFGGWDGTPSELDDNRGRFVKPIDVFDIAAEAFVPSALQFGMLPMRRAFSATVLNGQAILAGGLGEGGFMNSDMFADVIAYMPPPKEMEQGKLDAACEKCRSARPPGFTQGDAQLLAYLPEPIFSPGIGTWGEDLVVAGGVWAIVAPYEGFSSSKVRMLKKGGKSWEDLPVTMSEAKSFVEVQDLLDGRLALIGGHRGEEADALPSSTMETVTR